MPTYEYQCKSCAHRFEIWQRMADEPLTVCPECHGAIRRVLYPAGIVFKGSGFYKTDHGNGAVVSESKDETKDKNKETETKKETDGEGEPKTAAGVSKPKTAAATATSRRDNATAAAD